MNTTLLLSLITIFSASLMDNLSDYENFLNTSILTDYHYEPLHFDPEAYIWENDPISVYEYQINGDSIFNFRKTAVYYLPIEKNWVSAEDMIKICDYSFGLCKELANKIVTGEIGASVYEDKGNRNGNCGYCPYVKECRANPVSQDRLKQKPDVKDAKGLVAYIDEKNSKEGEE